jgi:hypothetical protein
MALLTLIGRPERLGGREKRIEKENRRWVSGVEMPEKQFLAAAKVVDFRHYIMRGTTDGVVQVRLLLSRLCELLRAQTLGHSGLLNVDIRNTYK